jgi:diguanylate cyclase (GGDEF)-like protein
MARANELRDAIGSAPVVVGNVERSITASLGVAVSSGSGAKELEQLLSRADAALYMAKENGRNRVEHMKGSPRKSAKAHKAPAQGS